MFFAALPLQRQTQPQHWCVGVQRACTSLWLCLSCDKKVHVVLCSANDLERIITL